MTYPYGYCGMPCALCTRYRTEGTSRCPGCSANGYYTEPCKVHHCCVENERVHCGACPDFHCARLGKMGDFSDLTTGGTKERTCTQISETGFDAWYAEYEARAALLTEALRLYNNGRMKRYLCELFIQNKLCTLQEIMRRAQDIPGDIKARGKAFRALADALRVPLEEN